MTIYDLDTDLVGDEFIIKPDPESASTTAEVQGVDSFGRPLTIPVVEERPLTLFLNNREIVTLMTVGDYPELLGVGYLVNQNMLKDDDVITEVEFDEELDVVVVRTERVTNYEEKLKRKVLTSGCGMGTVFGDIMDKLEDVVLGDGVRINASWIEPLLKTIKTTPSLYRKAGSIHGCVLCKDNKPLIYMEDVGRHNALDKIAGYLYLNKLQGSDYYMYTTGRMTSEMVMKAVSMNVSVLISRSGSTHWGVQLAKKAGLTLISRARGKRFIALSGMERIVFDLDETADQMSHRAAQ
ncbi:formate dehydrogenase accessory sulfurtransferase FdhD [Terasakiella sp. A23]|uniref:formate dehydrogenase accessory sulfurtransferase FdhD n=1 Tax=Terasakiella sp. FCG-A23 TaxID=3080561 RepID=UPI002952B932|nr:formate dehydrogenase accessory sulfurtransferase FdhD [Terasakiella sp. A23]MDV7340235.1 formate dehydrogenase accessory sulfurtransferase FdhD [Terasakiella sp. A23]